MTRWVAFIIWVLLSPGTLGLLRAAKMHHVFRLTSDQLKLWQGVSASEVELLVGGRHNPVRDVELIGPVTSPLESPMARRLWVIHIDSRLDFREQFRSRRWVKKFLQELMPDRDLVAVYHAGALSKFSADRIEVERMVDFFNTDFDRYNFGTGRATEGHWFGNSRWPFSPARPEAYRPREPISAPMNKGGARGDLRNALSSLNGLIGRKIVLHFGRTLPFTKQNVEFHDPVSALRWAADTQLSSYAVIPRSSKRKPPDPDPALNSWVEATGGQVFDESSDLLNDLRSILEQTAQYLVVGFETPPQGTGRFIEVQVKISRPPLVLQSKGGYFDAACVEMPLHERAFLAAAVEDSRFSQPPIDLSAEPSEFRGLRVALSFPLEKVRFEVIDAGTPAQRLFQEIHLFVGLYGAQNQLLDFVQDRFELDLDQEDVRNFFPRDAILKRLLEPRTRARPTTVRAVVVIGQNRQISARQLLLP